MKPWFHPAFEIELIDAARYLEQQRSDLGRQFLDEVEGAIDELSKHRAVGALGTATCDAFFCPDFVTRYVTVFDGMRAW